MQATIKVMGMSCAHCAASVKGALEALDGVRSADVNLEGACAVTEYDENKLSPADLKTAIEEVGFEADV